jgi:hypothetical protein
MSSVFSDIGHHLRLNRTSDRSPRQPKTRYPTHRRSYFDAAAEKRAYEHL